MRVRTAALATRWPWMVAVAGLAIVALAFAPAWIVHHRELTGEGYRSSVVTLSAWRDVARPVVSAAAVAAGLVALLALAVASRRAPAWMLLPGAAAVLGLLLASAWPVTQVGYASRVMLTPGWALVVAIGLGVVMVMASVAVAGIALRLVGASVALAAVVLVAGSAGRAVALHVEEGDGRHWQEGSYTRAATADEPTETLTIEGAEYRIGDRWAGSFSWFGWSVVLEDDPACPDARGVYHARAAEAGGLEFTRLVDLCREGERERDLEAGTWTRDG